MFRFDLLLYGYQNDFTQDHRGPVHVPQWDHSRFPLLRVRYSNPPSIFPISPVVGQYK